jgi:hypothetical protein
LLTSGNASALMALQETQDMNITKDLKIWLALLACLAVPAIPVTAATIPSDLRGMKQP